MKANTNLSPRQNSAKASQTISARQNNALDIDSLQNGKEAETGKRPERNNFGVRATIGEFTPISARCGIFIMDGQ